jgi:hypothetical protein
VNTEGTRVKMISRVMPPPIAVTVPSSTAGSHPSPADSVLSAPADAHSEMAAASTSRNIRSQARCSMRITNATPAPASAVGM